MANTAALAEHAGKQPSAPLIALRATLTFTGTYSTGGEALDAAALLQSLGGYDKAPTVLAVLPENKDGFVFYWDRANSKLLAFYADYDAVADGALIEFANGGDLAAALTGATVDVLILAQ